MTIMIFSKKMSARKIHPSWKLMISYSILLVLILAVGLYLYNITKKDIVRNAQNQNRLHLSSTINSMDTQFKAMNNLALSIVRNSDLTELARMSASSPDFHLKAYKGKSSMYAYSPMRQLLPVETFFIYMPQSGYILSPSQFTSMDFYYREHNMSMEHYGQWKDTLVNPEMQLKFLPLSNYNSNNKNFLYIMSLDNYLFYSMPAYLCFIIDYETMTQIFSDIEFSSGRYLYVTNNAGDFQFSIGKPPEYSTDLSYISTFEYKDDIASHTFGSETMNIIRCTSSTNSWIYYLLEPQSIAASTLSQYKNMFLLTMVSGLCIGIILLYFLSKHNARPVIQLDAQLKDSIFRTHELESVLEKQQPLIQNSYIRNIMLGRISTRGEMDYIQNYLGLTNTDVKYYVLYIVAYLDGSSKLDDDVSSFLDEMEEFIPSSVSSHHTNIIACLEKHFGDPLYLFNPKQHNYAVLIVEPSDTQVSPSLSEKFLDFHNEMLNSYSIWTIGGIGNPNHFLGNTWKSFQQAQKAVSYASNAHILYSYDSIDLSSDIYYYPSQLEESLINFISAGNLDQTKEIFKFIHRENLEKRSLSYPKMQTLLMELHNTLAKIRYTIPDTETNELIENVDHKLKEYLSLKQLEDIANDLCRFFSGRSSKKQTISNIQSYIHENFKDSSLCLAKLSDEFGLSESYLSYLFKEETGENFSMYLERIRMDEAMKLVKESSTALSSLYLEVGYNNANSFRRAFKKTFGMSAKAVRDNMMNQ